MWIFIFLMVLFVCGLGGAILYLVYIPIKKKLLIKGIISSATSKIINRLYFTLIFLYAVYSTITAIYPLNGFYKSEFEFNTGLDFPKSGKIIRKDSEYPDLHGNYWAASAFQVSQTDYDSLFRMIQKLDDFMIDTSKYGIGISRDFDKIEAGFKREGFHQTFMHKKAEWFKIVFVNDRKTIIFERSSS